MPNQEQFLKNVSLSYPKWDYGGHLDPHVRDALELSPLSPEAGKQGVYQLDKPIRRRRCLIFDDCRWRTDSLSGTTEAVGAALFHHLIVVPADSERCASLSHKQRPTVLARDFQDCRPIIGPTAKPGYTLDGAADVYRSIEPVN